MATLDKENCLDLLLKAHPFNSIITCPKCKSKNIDYVQIYEVRFIEFKCLDCEYTWTGKIFIDS